MENSNLNQAETSQQLEGNITTGEVIASEENATKTENQPKSKKTKTLKKGKKPKKRKKTRKARRTKKKKAKKKNTVRKGYAGYHKMTDNLDLVSQHNLDLMEEFLAYKTKTLSPKSIDMYRSWVQCFLCWNQAYNDNTAFESIKLAAFSEYFDHLIALHLSVSRLQTLRSALSSMSDTIELLHEDDMPSFKNRVRLITLPAKVRQVEKVVVSQDKVKKTLNALKEKDPEAACYFALLACCGCRKSEAAQMKVAWFTKKHEAFGGYVWETEEVRSKGRGVAGKKIRKYIIKEEFEPWLNLWLNKRTELGVTSEYLFTNPTTKGMDTIVLRIKKIFPKFHSHSMRHYFCTKLKKRNLSDDQIRDIFSWESVEMVKIYDDTTERARVKKAFGKLNRAAHPVKKRRCRRTKPSI